MGQLARWSAQVLGEAFIEHLGPRGLVPTLRYEADVFPRSLCEEIGYSPAADLLVEYTWDGSEVHAWIELEVSRADPVANPAKFLVAFSERSPQPGEVFVFAISRAIQRGRAALCRRFVQMMRDRGFPVYAEDFLPSATEHLITRLNVRSREEFEQALATEPENLRRALREDLRSLARRVHQYATGRD
ncbi:MAG: hypothetical protein LAP39_27610 [Acidobacteriia bacterium]|nr:hypothetical protein [Terriglobia bacterium]